MVCIAALLTFFATKWSELCVLEESASTRAVEESKSLVNSVLLSHEAEFAQLFNIFDNYQPCSRDNCHPGIQPLFHSIATKLNLSIPSELYIMKFAAPSFEYEQPHGSIQMLHGDGGWLAISANPDMDGLTQIMAKNLKSDLPQTMIWSAPEERFPSKYYRVAVPVVLNNKTVGAVVVVSKEVKNNRFMVSPLCYAL